MTDNKGTDKGKGEETELKEFEEAFDFETEDEMAPAASSTSSKATETASSAQIAAKPSKIPLIIGGIVVAFLGWKGYGFLFSKPTSLDNEKPPKEEMAAAAILKEKEKKPEPKTEPEVTPAEHIQPATVETIHTAPPPAPLPDATAKQITALEHNQKQIIDKINQLDASVNQALQAITPANQNSAQVTELTKEMSMLTATVQKLNKEVKTLKTKARAEEDYNRGEVGPFKEHYDTEMGPRPSKIKKQGTLSQKPSQTVKRTEQIVPETESYASPSMAVHAIIPGRAWLKTKDGSTITVTEGDNLEHYGKVLVIDAPNGVVITSSGATLR